MLEKFDKLGTDFSQLQSSRDTAVQEIIRRVKEELRTISLDAFRLQTVEKSVAEFRSLHRNMEKEKAILESLKFEVMHHRYDAITDAHDKTFGWIFDPESFPSTDRRSKIAFKSWLEGGDGIYWISGKPGSGKSTLMKYLCDCDETKTCLLSWAGNAKLGTATFYF